MNNPLFEISDELIDPKELTNKVSRRKAGAITLFLGTVRELTFGKKTLYLEYEAYPAVAVSQLERIGQEVRDR